MGTQFNAAHVYFAVLYLYIVFVIF